MTAAVIVAAFLLYFLMYRTYGKGFERKLIAASSDRETPAHRMYDGVDYVPANRYVLFGHHFASIAGAAPIVGPAIAMAWGWLPALLWVWLGNVFIGAVHDYLSLMASVRHDGHSIQYISGKLMSKRTGYIFELFVFLALILVIAAFSAVIGSIFVKIPAASTASAFFILAAVITGWLLYRSPLSFQAATLVGLGLLLLSILLGARLPIKLPYRSWLVLLWLYIIIASSLPVWTLLQPRDYLNSYLLWAGLLVGGVSLILAFSGFKTPSFTSFAAPVIAGTPSPFWPTVPLIIACGSLSGFHSLVASGTTSKQLDKEIDGLFIGYGAMFTEGFLSTIVIASIAAFGLLALGDLGQTLSGIKAFGNHYVETIGKIGGPIGIFSKSYGIAVNKALRLPLETVVIFANLWVVSFALTTLDTTNRLGRFAWTEILEPLRKKSASLYRILSNKWIASLFVATLGIWLAWGGAWKVIWPAFGGTNQMLASIALMTVSLWVVKELKANLRQRLQVIIPAFLLWGTVLAALLWYLLAAIPVYHAKNPTQSYLIGGIVVIEIILNLMLLTEYFRASRRKT